MSREALAVACGNLMPCSGLRAIPHYLHKFALLPIQLSSEIGFVQLQVLLGLGMIHQLM